MTVKNTRGVQIGIGTTDTRLRPANARSHSERGDEEVESDVEELSPPSSPDRVRQRNS